MKDKLKSTEVEKWKSAEVEKWKSAEVEKYHSTIPPFNPRSARRRCGMNREQVADKERGEEKGKPPYNPLKEKEVQKEISAVPEPVPVHHAGARVRAQADRAPSRPPIGTGTGTVGFRQDFGTGTGSVEIRPGVTFRLESFHILDGRREDGTRNDPVSVALVALRLPKIAEYPNGRRYNNARLLRHYVHELGEEYFRELLHQQWRENAIDGEPHNRAAAFMAKLFKASRGGAA